MGSNCPLLFPWIREKKDFFDVIQVLVGGLSYFVRLASDMSGLY